MKNIPQSKTPSEAIEQASEVKIKEFAIWLSSDRTTISSEFSIGIGDRIFSQFSDKRFTYLKFSHKDTDENYYYANEQLKLPFCKTVKVFVILTKEKNFLAGIQIVKINDTELQDDIKLKKQNNQAKGFPNYKSEPNSLNELDDVFPV